MKKLIMLVLGLMVGLSVSVSICQAESIKDRAFQAKEIVGYSSLEGWKTYTGGGLNFKDDKFSIGGAIENESPISEAGIFATVNIEKVKELEKICEFKNDILLFFLPDEIAEKCGSNYGGSVLCNWEGKTRYGVAVIVDIIRIEFGGDGE